jgi:hypothetical protein
VVGSTAYRTKRRFVLGNVELALREETCPGAARKPSGKEEALLVATACSSTQVVSFADSSGDVPLGEPAASLT